MSTLEDFVHFVDAEFDFSAFGDLLLVCARDLVTGLAFLHSNGIAHRNLKPGNTLVCNQHYDKDDLQGSYAKCPIVCKLADFGLSRSLDIQTCSFLETRTESTFYKSMFYKSTFYKSVFYKSTFYKSVFYKSTFYKSVFYKSTFYKSVFYKSMFYKSTFYKSVFYKSTFYKSTFYKSVFYKSTFYKSVFYKSSPCFTNPLHSTPVHVLQYALENVKCLARGL